jgi:hypothetical protein
MTEEEIRFLNEVKSKSRDPYMMRQIISVAISGLEEYTDNIRRHAVDMEVVANMAMNKCLFKGNEKFLADKLESWKNYNGLRWDDQIKALREKSK